MSQMMKALIYQGPGMKALEDRPKPELQAAIRRNPDHQQRRRESG